MANPAAGFFHICGAASKRQSHVFVPLLPIEIDPGRAGHPCLAKHRIGKSDGVWVRPQPADIGIEVEGPLAGRDVPKEVLGQPPNQNVTVLAVAVHMAIQHRIICLLYTSDAADE